MFNRIHEIYFSHTAIRSGHDTTSSKDGRIDGDSIDGDFNSAFNNSTGSVKKELDVFLSFRGKDTRNTFTGHLYEALKNAGINTFIDDEELLRGETIRKELERKIEGSRISVVVFSKKYANSSWCLEELSMIMDCRRNFGQMVVPIFYGVDPSDVRKQTGAFGKGFRRQVRRLLPSEWKQIRNEIKKRRSEKNMFAGLTSLFGEASARPNLRDQLADTVVEEWMSCETEYPWSNNDSDVKKSESEKKQQEKLKRRKLALIPSEWEHIQKKENKRLTETGNETPMEDLFFGPTSLFGEDSARLTLEDQPTDTVVETESERKQKKEKLERWKLALTEAANLSGWHSGDSGNDAKLIKVIVEDILKKTLSTANLHVAPYPVGMHPREEVRSLLKLEVDDHKVRIVGICGMPGVGKTTIAKAIYNIFNSQFGSSRSFLENVRQIWDQPHGQVRLQKQLLFHILKKKVDWVDCVDKGIQAIKDTIGSKRVLVIVDDVDHMDQLNALAGGHEWFGPGSIIIITTRNQQLLEELKADAAYIVPEMNEIESLELFSWHAFGERQPKEEYIELSKSVVNYCGGLPLALTVLGSYLKSMSTKSMWICELEKLKRIPHGDVLKKLKISFDGLSDDTLKDIFLNISCFFIGMDMNYVQEILDGCGLHANSRLRHLLKRCLITINERNKIMMHDLLRDMGRAVVEEKLTHRPEERSRLWFHEDVFGV